MFILKKITKSYDNYPVINDKTFQFNDARYCISGPNGCGKTTLLMLMSGIEPLDSGSITFNEQAVSLIKTTHQIGVSSDKILFPDFLTPQKLLEFHCSQHSCSFPTDIIESLNFSPQLQAKISQLSLGNLKKISLLIAISHQPLSLILDEPTTGLDNESRAWLLNYLDQYKGQVIVASHEQNFLANAKYTQIDLLEVNKREVC